MTGLRLQLLGPVQVWVDRAPLPRLRTRKGYLLLALLALREGAPISRDWLVGTLWPESDQEAGAFSLRRALHDLRAALGTAESALLAPDRRHLRLAREHTRVDVWELKSLLSQSPVDAEAILALYRGPLLPDFDAAFLVPERQHLHDQVVRALLRAGEQAEERGEVERALSWARQGTLLEPFSEPLQRLLYRALAAAGDPAAARRAYREFRGRLFEELRQEPSAETRHCIDTLPEALATPAPTLPQFLSTFIGREQQQECLRARLVPGALVTLLGPGGVGKTRLAVEVAREEARRFSHGLLFVDLTTLSTPADEGALWRLMERTVCGEREAEPVGAREVVLRTLAGKACLLVLDNAEQVSLLRFLVPTLLKAVPTLAVLVTSRTPLGVLGECLLPLEPLTTPVGDALGTVLASEAARLLVQRVQALRPTFALTEHNASDIAQLCRRLDGLPLALELAAARLRYLSLSDLMARLHDPLPLLEGGEQHPERQRTLARLIGASYDPLPPPCQQLLARLSLFPDTVSLAAVEALGAAPETVAHLGRLVDASLVQVIEDRFGTIRYRLLETIRAFAHQKLREGGDVVSAQERLTHWAMAFLSEAYEGLWGREGGHWLERIGQELANLEAAFQTAEGEGALRIAHLLEQFWWRTNRLREGIAWFDRALAQSGGSEGGRRDCELGREQFLNLLGEPNRVVEVLEAAFAQAQERGDTESAFYLTHTLGLVLAKRQHYPAAVAHLQTALALAEVQQDSFYRAYAELGLLEVLLEAGRLAEARAYGVLSLSRFEAQGRQAHVVQVQLQLGRVARVEGWYEEATALLERGLVGAQAGGMRDLEQELLLALGETAEAQGDRMAARHYYTLLVEKGEVGGQWGPVEQAKRALERVV